MDMTTETVLDQKQLKKHYKEAVEYLDKQYAYFLTHILHIGRPIWTHAIQTAAVAMQQKEDSLIGKLNPFDKLNKPNYTGAQTEEEYDFDFMFSPQFASKLTTPGMAFILAHETLHIVLNHLRLVNDFVDRDRMKELQKKSQEGTRLTKDELKELIEGSQAAGKFNIAADCVINDYLVHAGLPDTEFYNNPGNPMYDEKLPPGIAMLCRGQDKIGENAAFLTVHDVYEQLEEQAQQQKQNGQGEDGDGSSGSGSGQPGSDCDMDGRGAQAIDSHDWLLDPDFAEELADAIDKMNDEIEQAGKLPSDLQDKKDEENGQDSQATQKLQKSMRAGSEDGNMKEFMGATGAKLGWVKLMKELDPDMFKEPAIAPPPAAQWHKRPRKLAGMPKNVVLPVREQAKREKQAREKPAIVLALDVSGSIGPRDADRFIELAKSIPQERIKLFTCTFDTQYAHIPDIVNEHNFRIGGGTDFDAIPRFIDDIVKPELKGKYPKAVVIITDGQAQLSLVPDAKEGEGWFWLISPADRSDANYYNASRNVGRRDKLENYVV
jgi:predicted metal-dependent peptidase